MTRHQRSGTWRWTRRASIAGGGRRDVIPYDADHGLGPAEPAAIDIARVLLYARNLAATRTLSERPRLADLLTAASATVGKRYAGQVYLLSMKVARPRRASVAEALRNVPALTYEIVGSRQGYRCKGRWLTVEPVWSPAGPRIEMWVPAPAEVARRQEAPYRHVPRAQKGSRYAWMAYPPDEQAYEAYVAHVLRRASLHALSEPAAEPFLAGLRDGIDVRATLRHWKEGRLYVREDREEWLTVTNGAIDYTSEREDSTVLRGRGRRGGRGGWVDPSLTSVGSASRDDTPRRDPGGALPRDTPAIASSRSSRSMSPPGSRPTSRGASTAG